MPAVLEHELARSIRIGLAHQRSTMRAKVALERSGDARTHSSRPTLGIVLCPRCVNGVRARVCERIENNENGHSGSPYGENARGSGGKSGWSARARREGD